MLVAAQIIVGLGTIYVVVQAIILWRSEQTYTYYCDSCDRSLGSGRGRDKVCPRRGDNRYYRRPIDRA